MTQGAPKNPNIIDIDATLATRFEEPLTLRFAGRDWTLRRDLTAEELVQFWKFSDSGQNVEAWTILVGNAEDAKELQEGMQALPMEIFTSSVRKILRAIGMNIDVADVNAAENAGGEGNSSAS